MRRRETKDLLGLFQDSLIKIDGLVKVVFKRPEGWGKDLSHGGEAHPTLWAEDKDYAIREFSQFRKAVGFTMIVLKIIPKKTKNFKEIPLRPGIRSGRHKG